MPGAYEPCAGCSAGWSLAGPLPQNVRRVVSDEHRKDLVGGQLCAGLLQFGENFGVSDLAARLAGCWPGTCGPVVVEVDVPIESDGAVHGCRLAGLSG